MPCLGRTVLVALAHLVTRGGAWSGRAHALGPCKALRNTLTVWQPELKEGSVHMHDAVQACIQESEFQAVYFKLCCSSAVASMRPCKVS